MEITVAEKFSEREQRRRETRVEGNDLPESYFGRAFEFLPSEKMKRVKSMWWIMVGAFIA